PEHRQLPLTITVIVGRHRNIPSLAVPHRTHTVDKPRTLSRPKHREVRSAGVGVRPGHGDVTVLAVLHRTDAARVPGSGSGPEHRWFSGAVAVIVGRYRNI